MFRIKWNNGIYDYVTTYYEPFKRLDYCNAAWYEIENTDSKHNALGHKIHTIKYGFVSYDTPICLITYHHDIDTNRDCFNVYVNRESYHCSSATTHQLVRFLRKAMGDLLTYQDLRMWDDRYPMRHDLPIQAECFIHLFWSDAASMRYRMEQTAHAIYHTNKA